MLILGIETSCDDTGIAILEVAPTKVGVVFNVLSNTISSQIKTHAPFGGVVPNLAAREHLKNIGPCLKTALKETNKTINDVDLIAVTVGPGLIPSLLIGVNFAKALAYKYNIPIIAVNHLEGHIIAASGSGISNSKFLISKQKFPAIALLVSGGHTQLVLMRKFGQYKIIGETRDDAAGECFDKVAKLLRLPYPGGPEIAKQAAKANPKSQILNPKLPRPMISHQNFDFSFSGLKTAVLYLIQSQKSKIKNQKFIQEVCYETQQAIIDVLISKTFKAVEKYHAKTVILSGGVAANEELRKQFAFKIQNLPAGRHGSKFEINFLVPPKNLCMDNGAMIAMAGYFDAKRHPSLRDNSINRIIANANLRIR
jgi:N6-L-threonylcarbamoyladenine synthase